MKIRAAVLSAMGTAAPYANLEAADDRGTGTRPARTGRGADPDQGRRPVPFRPVGDQRRPAAALADGARATRRPASSRRSGPGIDDLARGDHVVCVFVPSCGHCGPCAEGRPALCEPGAAVNGAGTLLSGARRLHRADGTPVHHHLGVSGFAELRHGLAPLAGQDRPGAAAGRGGPVRLRRAHRRGCGGQHRAGPGRRLDRGDRPGRRRPVLAAWAPSPPVRARSSPSTSPTTSWPSRRQLGATATFSAKDPDCAEQVRSATGGGVEFAFELAGSVRALELAYKITRRGGTTVTAGLPPPTATMPLPAVNLVAEERTLKGSYIGTAVPSRDIPRFIQLYQRGRLPVDRLMSGILTLERDQSGLRPAARRHRDPPGRETLRLNG